MDLPKPLIRAFRCLLLLALIGKIKTENSSSTANSSIIPLESSGPERDKDSPSSAMNQTLDFFQEQVKSTEEEKDKEEGRVWHPDRRPAWPVSSGVAKISETSGPSRDQASLPSVHPHDAGEPEIQSLNSSEDSSRKLLMSLLHEVKETSQQALPANILLKLLRSQEEYDYYYYEDEEDIYHDSDDNHILEAEELPRAEALLGKVPEEKQERLFGSNFKLGSISGSNDKLAYLTGPGSNITFSKDQLSTVAVLGNAAIVLGSALGLGLLPGAGDLPFIVRRRSGPAVEEFIPERGPLQGPPGGPAFRRRRIPTSRTRTKNHLAKSRGRFHGRKKKPRKNSGLMLTPDFQRPPSQARPSYKRTYSSWSPKRAGFVRPKRRKRLPAFTFSFARGRPGGPKRSRRPTPTMRPRTTTTHVGTDQIVRPDSAFGKPPASENTDDINEIFHKPSRNPSAKVPPPRKRLRKKKRRLPFSFGKRPVKRLKKTKFRPRRPPFRPQLQRPPPMVLKGAPDPPLRPVTEMTIEILTTPSSVTTSDPYPPLFRDSFLAPRKDVQNLKVSNEFIRDLYDYDYYNADYTSDGFYDEYGDRDAPGLDNKFYSTIEDVADNPVFRIYKAVHSNAHNDGFNYGFDGFKNSPLEDIFNDDFLGTERPDHTKIQPKVPPESLLQELPPSVSPTLNPGNKRIDTPPSVPEVLGRRPHPNRVASKEKFEPEWPREEQGEGNHEIKKLPNETKPAPIDLTKVVRKRISQQDNDGEEKSTLIKMEDHFKQLEVKPMPVKLEGKIKGDREEISTPQPTDSLIKEIKSQLPIFQTDRYKKVLDIDEKDALPVPIKVLRPIRKMRRRKKQKVKEASHEEPFHPTPLPPSKPTTVNEELVFLDDYVDDYRDSDPDDNLKIERITKEVTKFTGNDENKFSDLEAEQEEASDEGDGDKVEEDNDDYLGEYFIDPLAVDAFLESYGSNSDFTEEGEAPVREEDHSLFGRPRDFNPFEDLEQFRPDETDSWVNAMTKEFGGFEDFKRISSTRK